MSVLKYWDSGTSSWQVAIVGAQGTPGPIGYTGSVSPQYLEIDGGNASTIHTAEITVDGGGA